MRWIITLLVSTLPLLGNQQNSDFVDLPKGKVYYGDYFVAGGSIEIFGEVKGDVFATGSQVLIDGVVEGDVIALAGTIRIAGRVEGNVRCSGGQIEVAGNIGKNITVLGGNVQFFQNSLVVGNVVAIGGMVDFLGTVQKEVNVTASSLRILGSIGENVSAYIGKMYIGPHAELKGDLSYKSGEKADIKEGAKILGAVQFKPSAIRGAFKGQFWRSFVLGSRILGILMNFLFCFVIGWLVMKVWPKKLEQAITVLEISPWKAFWSGLLVAFLLPLICLLLFITILGFPLALGLLAMSLLGFYSAKVFPILWITRRFLLKRNIERGYLVALGVGLLLFFIIAQIPFIGKGVSLVFTLLGLGALFLGKVARKKSLKRVGKSQERDQRRDEERTREDPESLH